MTPKLVRAAGLLVLLLAMAAPAASAATDAEIKKAIKGGTDAIKARYARGGAAGGRGRASRRAGLRERGRGPLLGLLPILRVGFVVSGWAAVTAGAIGIIRRVRDSGRRG